MVFVIFLQVFLNVIYSILDVKLENNAMKKINNLYSRFSWKKNQIYEAVISIRSWWQFGYLFKFYIAIYFYSWVKLISILSEKTKYSIKTHFKLETDNNQDCNG